MGIIPLPVTTEAEDPAAHPPSRRYDDVLAAGLVVTAPGYPAARRRFRAAVIGSLAVGIALAAFLPWWLGVIIGLGGTLVAVLLFRRAGRRLERKMRLWLRDQELSGPHYPGEG